MRSGVRPAYFYSLKEDVVNKRLVPINLSTTDPCSPVLINVTTDDGVVTHEAIWIDPQEIAVISPDGKGCVLTLRINTKAVVLQNHSAASMAKWHAEAMR